MIVTSNILYPCLTLVALTIIVWFKLLFDRMTEIRKRKIFPEDLGTATQVRQKLQNLNSADNFKNLLELPVLFYLLCILAIIYPAATPAVVGLAWIFVFSRVIHSFIHCSYNRAFHRFVAYVSGSIFLFLAWIFFAVEILA